MWFVKGERNLLSSLVAPLVPQFGTVSAELRLSDDIGRSPEWGHAESYALFCELPVGFGARSPRAFQTWRIEYRTRDLPQALP